MCEGSAWMVKQKIFQKGEDQAMVKKGDLKYPVEMILYEIYRMRGLTIDQLSKAIFESRVYAIRYLKSLKEEGLVTGKVYNHEKKRIGMQYFITEKGIDYLEIKGMVKKYTYEGIDENETEYKRSFNYEQMKNQGLYVPRKVLAYDNNQGMRKDKVLFTIYTNNIYAGLTPYGIYMYDSREWKVKYNLNSNALVRGGLRMKDDREYALYVLFSNEYIENAAVSEKMLAKIYYEIEENSQSNRFIVYVYGKDDYQRVVDYFKTNIVAGKELLIIPHGMNEIGLNMIRMLARETEHMQNVEGVLNARLIKDKSLEETTAGVFADYLTYHNGEKHYVLDFLRLNELKLALLQIQYTRERYQQDGKKVLILCWSFVEGLLKEQFQAYEYIETFGIDVYAIVDWLDGKGEEKLYTHFREEKR